jgi:hypothetical protein
MGNLKWRVGIAKKVARKQLNKPPPAHAFPFHRGANLCTSHHSAPQATANAIRAVPFRRGAILP